jgi:excisionase family DNA binding protein
MPLENVFTIEEISQHFRVPLDAIQREIDSGRLRTIEIGGFVRVRESDLDSLLNPERKNDTKDRNALVLDPTPEFSHTWPDKKVERFIEAHEGLASYGGKEYRVKLGFTVRNSAGRHRRRCLVLVDRYATVEFVAADEKSNGKMASIIKDRDGKQLPVGATLPPEYEGIPVGPYRDVVVGSGASNGLAVVCEQRDFDVMVKHALIRYRFRGDRK